MIVSSGDHQKRGSRVKTWGQVYGIDFRGGLQVTGLTITGIA